MRNVIWDCETTPLAWRREKGKKVLDFKAIKLKLLVVYDYTSQDIRVYGESNIDDFLTEYFCNYHVHLIGFNSKAFDKNVIINNFTDKLLDMENVPRASHWDLLEVIRESVGQPFFKGKLDDYARATLHEKKLTVNYETSKVFDLVNYCIQDVMLTKRLFDFVLKDGGIYHPTEGRIPLSTYYLGQI